ncbi:MAG: AbrB/MazE/SpoVT family DNA-binding domain-containing protein [Spirochaetaceae bacterium]|jgi:AbrB family looped-hinge helix DNA binding protein|nr:AbrB/MazE/SpoVT family DNA-binding domain-containing protein [Spirochaetaceae bacterium]
MVKYATVTEKGQITLPVEMRRALKLEPGKKLSITLEGQSISISKPADIDEVRELLRRQMAKRGTGKKPARSGDGWTAHVREAYDG